MPNTEYTKYTFTVKEGAPSEANGEAPTYLMCEPLTKELSILGNNGFMSIRLKDGTSIQEAKEIESYLKQHISGISITTF